MEIRLVPNVRVSDIRKSVSACDGIFSAQKLKYLDMNTPEVVNSFHTFC